MQWIYLQTSRKTPFGERGPLTIPLALEPLPPWLAGPTLAAAASLVRGRWGLHFCRSICFL